VSLRRRVRNVEAADHRRPSHLVANAFFVDEQQMTWCTEAEFDLVVGDELDDLDSDAIPYARAATDQHQQD